MVTGSFLLFQVLFSLSFSFTTFIWQITETIKTYSWFLCRLTLTIFSKHEALHSTKTNGGNVLFHLLVLSRCLLKLCFWKYISFRCFFYILLSCRCSLRFPFALHFLLFALFIICPWTKKKRERCVESLTRNITFPTVHPPPMEIPAKNTIGLSIKKSNFCFRCKRKTVISPPIFTLFHFFCSSHKDHIKDLLLAKNQNSNKIFRLTITGNLKMVVISFVCLLPVRPSALQQGGFVPRE